MSKNSTAKSNRNKVNAKILYLTGQYQQKEIAELIGVTVQTISRWVNTEKWELELVGLTVTKERQLSRIYGQISEINTLIAGRNVGERFAKGNEADTLNKLATAAQKLEGETGISDIVSVSIGVLEFARSINLNQAKELSELFDGYIKTKMN